MKLIFQLFKELFTLIPEPIMPSENNQLPSNDISSDIEDDKIPSLKTSYAQMKQIITTNKYFKERMPRFTHPGEPGKHNGFILYAPPSPRKSYPIVETIKDFDCCKKSSSGNRY